MVRVVFTPTRASGIVFSPADPPPVLGYPAILGERAAVAYYQMTLRGLGYDLGPGSEDGLWGDFTRRAVRAYQQRKGLAVDGLLGPITQRALQSEHARTAPVPLVPTRPSLANAPPTQVPVVRPPPASEWSNAPITVIHRPDQPWQDDPAVYGNGFLDNLSLSPSIGGPSTGTSPWVVVAALAAGVTGLVAFARYYDDRKAKR